MESTMYAPGAVHEWVEFSDPDNEDHFWRINVSFFLSNYNCIYGQGCPSIQGATPDPEIGCCSLGVTIVDKEDFQQVRKSVSQLTREDAANFDLIQNGWLRRNKKTKLVNGKCIFSNPKTEDGPPPGCAFHHLAERTGQDSNETKPFVCWLVPLYLNEEDLPMHSQWITTLGPVSAGHWGNDAELDYWCTDTPDAYNGKTVYYKYAQSDLTKLMGVNGYAKLCELLEAYGDRKFKMPGELNNDGNPMIADIVSLSESIREKRNK